MTITPRNHFWPKRWLRSFAGATLATAFVGGAIWAADPPLNFPPLPKEAPKTELPKIPDVPKKTDPKAEPVKPKLHTFAMSIKPWSDVIDWYKDESGLSFNSIEAPPTGTFNFSPAKDPKTGQPRQYTMSQVTDLINEALLTKNLILVRGEVSFRLWPADKKIDPVLVRRVSLEELKTLAARDLVQVVVDLKALIAADQVPNVTKMMSNIGEVVAMDGGRNALIMIDLAGNLRRIIDDLTTSETSESGQTPEQHSHKCVYVKARDAASQLRELIGAEPAAEGPLAAPTRGDGRERRFGEGFDPSRFGQGFDPSRFGQGFDPSRMGMGGGSRGPRAAKPTRVISDDSTNTVHLTGPADKINQAKTFLTKVDVGTDPIKIGKAEWQNYPVPAGMAELLAQALTEKYRGTNIGVKALSGSQIMAYAAPADQFDIITFINDTTKAQKEITKTLPIAGMDLAEAVTLLKSMFPSQASGGPFIDKHPNETGVIVKGKPEQVAEVELVIKSGIGVSGDGVGSTGGGGTRIINLKDGSAADLAEAIKQMMEGMGKPGVKVIRPGGSPTPPPIPPSSLIPPAKPFPKPPAPPDEKDKSGAGQPGSIKTYGLGVRDLDTSKMLVMGGGQVADPSEVKKNPDEAGVIITAVGNKLIITGSDAKAVALAHELALQLVKNKGETYQVFRLTNANASEAARVLNEWFNPPPPQQQRNQNPFAQLFPGGGGGGRGGNPFAPQPPAPNPEDAKPRVRIVAEQSSNSLLVRANALDLITIKNLLDTVIDVGPGDSKAIVKPFTIGPLQYAVATEVVATVQQVFRESTNQAASQGGTSGGFAAFSPFGGIGGGGRQQPLDSLGRPKQVSLTIAADDRTNTILGTATGEMAEDIKKMVQYLEDKAKDSTKVVQLVATKGIDPSLIQEVIDAIQGRTPATRTGQQPGMNPFGQQGGNPFGGGGNFGGGNNPFGGGQGRFGGGGGGFGTPGGGRFGGGGAGPGGGRGAGGGGGARPGGGRGGGRMQRAPEPPGSGDVGRGPDFFEQRDKDVPQQTLLYDPYEESLNNRAANGLVADGVQTLDPVQLAGGKQLPPGVMLAQAKVDPPVAPKSTGTTDLIGPRGTVTANPLSEFGAVIVTANNQADLELVLKIIDQLRKHLEETAATSGPSLKMYQLKNADAIGVASRANQLGERAASSVTLRAQGGALGQTTTSGSGSVLLIPVPRQNAILMFGPEIRFPYYERLMETLDQPNSNLPTAIKLNKASAQQVATYLTNFYNIRYPDESQTTNLVRFSYSTAANTVFVQAGPGDLEEIRGIIESLDKATPPANELRIIRLKNTVADDLATTLETALMANIMPQGLGVVQPTIQPGAGGGGGGLPFGPGGQQQQPGAQQQPGGANQAGGGRGVLGSAATNTTKTVSLRFLVPGKQGTFESAYLEDVHITPDIRSNSLIVSAPKQTLELLEEVIKNLDIPSVARAQVNIFTLKRADATLTANLLQQLFSGAQRPQGAQGGPLGQQGPGAQQQPGAANTSPLRPLLTATGSVSDGAGLLDLRISVDDRTNSIIVAATQNDLDAIRAIIARLEDAEIQQRATHVIKLRNASAVDVAGALTPFLTESLTVINTGLTVTNYLTTSRNIIVAPEPVTNNLLISATPAALATLIPIIEQLDAQPLQVSIEVLIAEVALTNNEEFGVEVGLQSPILFGRSVIPTDSGVSLSNTTGSVIPPGTTVNSTTPIYSGSSFPFNNITTGQPNSYMMPYKQGVVALQGLTNYGVGRASQNGIGGFVFSGGSDTVNVLIRALKTQGRVDNLTRPNITVLDNQIGSVNVGGLFPYVSGGQFTQFGTFQPQISQQQIGTTLTVTPRISPEGRILMRVEPSIIAPEDTLVPLGNGQFATSFRQQAVQTTVSVMDGETIVLGGLITKSNIRQENKVPWLGDLPYIGAAFRYRTQTQEKRELLVILTPHVIRCSADSERLLMEEARKMSWKLADVDRMSRSVQPLPSAVDVGPPSPPLPSPRDGVVYPDGGTPLPPPVLVPDPKPMPPKGVIPVMPPPVKPKVPDALPPIPIPDPPKASALPMGDGMVPASGIVIPGERR
jgi:type II secretory pathway component GspD/PulD (secretin)